MDRRTDGRATKRGLRIGATLIALSFLGLAFSGGPVMAAPPLKPAGTRMAQADSYEHVAPLLSPAARGRCLAPVRAAAGPLLLVVGASYTAGTGAGSPLRSWAVDLARALGWRAVIAGVPGIGFVHRSPAGVGPVSRLLQMVGDRSLAPSLVVIQAGHDDGRVPHALERQRVARLVAGLRRALPEARLAFITVFARAGRPSARLLATNRAIIGGIAQGDPQAVVLDPFRAHWRFARRSRGALHPSVRGDRQIAGDVLAQLEAAGVAPQLAVMGTQAPLCALVPGHASGRLRRRWADLRPAQAGGEAGTGMTSKPRFGFSQDVSRRDFAL